MQPSYHGAWHQALSRAGLQAGESAAGRSFSADASRRVRSVATTKQRVKILYFKHFFKHFVFIEKSDFDIKKVQKKYIDVNVCLDVDCVDKK